MSRRRVFALAPLALAAGVFGAAWLGGDAASRAAVEKPPSPPAGVEDLLREAAEIDGLFRLVVVRDGELRIDGSFAGTKPDDLLHLRSATKSVVSLLVGIALDRGELGSLDLTLGELLGERVRRFGPEKAGLTLYHLLTMSAGLEWNEMEDVDEFNRLVRSADPLSHYLSRDRVRPPGEAWAYSSGASHLLSLVLETATGSSTAAFAERHLFGPLGIEAYRWPRLRDGTTNGSAGLQLRAADTAKIGQLLLAKGEWGGRRVVSADWIERATTPRMAVGGGLDYGLHWWIASEPADVWLALGYAGQMIAVVPGVDLVVVTNCRWRGLRRSPGAQSMQVQRFVQDRVGPLLAPELFASPELSARPGAGPDQPKTAPPAVL